MLEQYYRINQAAGVSININQDGSIVIQLCAVIANGNKLDIDKRITDLKAVGQLKEQLSAKSVIALNLSGKGVLQKKIEKQEQIDQNNFGKILPNASIDDFYVQNFISDDHSFVSVIRRNDADRFISQLNELGYESMMLSLSVFPVENILAQLNVYEGEFSFNGHFINRDDKGEWTDYYYKIDTKPNVHLKIALESIDEKLILPYAAAFQLVLVNKIDPIRADVPTLEQDLTRKLSRNKLKLQAFIFLGALFFLLLINLIVFSSLNSTNANLLEKVSHFAQHTSDRENVDGEIKKKEAQLQALGWDEGVNKSSLIDQVAALLPADIILTEITINPVNLASSRSNKALTFYHRKMRVTGNSEKIIPVNEWIARLKVKKWVKEIQLDNFTFDNELNTGRFNLTIDY